MKDVRKILREIYVTLPPIIFLLWGWIERSVFYWNTKVDRKLDVFPSYFVLILTDFVFSVIFQIDQKYQFLCEFLGWFWPIFPFRSFFNSSLSSFFPLSFIFFPLSSTVPCILGNGLVVVCTITSRKSILLFFFCKCWSTDVPWYLRVESFVFEW